MKKTFALLLFLGAAVAVATPVTKVARRAASTVATQPTTATDGVPGETGGYTLRTVFINAVQVFDGGTASTDFHQAQAKAWVGSSFGRYDGGVGFMWKRAPQYDLQFDAGAAIDIYTQASEGFVLQTTINDFPPASRLSYSLTNIALVDGGSNTPDIYVEGVYVLDSQRGR
jgi:hypothetical protein